MTITVGVSIGIVVLDEDDPRDAAQILRDADTAMYQAKTTGRGTTHFVATTAGLSPFPAS